MIASAHLAAGIVIGLASDHVARGNREFGRPRNGVAAVIYDPSSGGDGRIPAHAIVVGI